MLLALFPSTLLAVVAADAFVPHMTAGEGQRLGPTSIHANFSTLSGMSYQVGISDLRLGKLHLSVSCGGNSVETDVSLPPATKGAQRLVGVEFDVIDKNACSLNYGVRIFFNEPGFQEEARPYHVRVDFVGNKVIGVMEGG